MRRTLITFLLLSCLLCSTLYLSRYKSDKKNMKLSQYPNVNLKLEQQYNKSIQEIEKYRLGSPRFGYDNPNSPYSNSYRLHPKAFIPDYRQPIDGIVPDDYKDNLPSENLMYAQLDCIDEETNCMDKTKDYYSDLLN
jgi:hypothetical protein